MTCRAKPRLLIVLAFALAPALASAAPDEDTLGKTGYQPCKDVRASLSAEHCLVWVMSHYEAIYPSHPVKKGTTPRELKRASAPAPVDVDKFLAANRNTGLLIMKGDTIYAERYQYERTAESRFAAPAPITPPLITWVVESGKPKWVEARITEAPTPCEVNPCAASILMIRVPVVLMIRQPPL